MANSITKHIPNALTSSNLICGCIATAFAFGGCYEKALLFIILGAVFDFFDGMSARLLNVSSPIGKELDSLADDVTFGVAPSAMTFGILSTNDYPIWLQGISSLLPYLAFIMAAFSAIRLAKFNLDERQATSFIGVPTPANALFWGSLIVGFEDVLSSTPYMTLLIIAMIFVCSYLLIAEIPLFALKFKHWGWKGNEVKYVFIVSSLLLLAIFDVAGIAVVIGWYVILAVISNQYKLL
ncbi:MAG: CDP-diacylglycerol--serine O-phosphatidyltransferase [Prevotella sp.]